MPSGLSEEALVDKKKLKKIHCALLAALDRLELAAATPDVLGELNEALVIVECEIMKADRLFEAPSGEVR